MTEALSRPKPIRYGRSSRSVIEATSRQPLAKWSFSLQTPVPDS